MHKFLILAVSASLILSGCSGFRESRANPSNWFGGGPAAPAQTDEAASANPLIPERRSIFLRTRVETYDGTLVGEITDIAVEPTAHGAIVRVTGVTDMPGAFDIRLINETDDKPVDGVLRYSLKALQPPQRTGTGSDLRARTVQAGAFVPARAFEQTTQIEVLGARNSVATGR